MSGVITLIGASNMHLEEGDAGVVPQVYVYCLGAVKSFLFKTKYKVTKRKQRVEIKWNQSVPFQFFRTSRFLFHLYHKKLMGDFKRLGHGIMNLETDPLASPFKIELESDIEGLTTRPSITVQVDYKFHPYPTAPLTVPCDLIYVYLTYDPIPADASAVCSVDCMYLNGSFRYYTVVTKYSAACLVGKTGGSMLFSGPTGWTPVLRINKNKITDSVMTFIVSSRSYAGTVTVNMVGVMREKKKDGIYYVESDKVALMHKEKVTVRPGCKVSLPEFFVNTEKKFIKRDIKSCVLQDIRNLGDFERGIIGQVTPKPCWRRIMASIDRPLTLAESARFLGVADLSQLAVIWGWKRRVKDPENESSGKMNVFLHVFDNQLKLVDSICPKRPFDKKKALNGIIHRHKKNPYLLKPLDDMPVKYKDHANVLIDMAKLRQKPEIFAMVVGITGTVFESNVSKFWKTYVRMADPVTKKELMFYPYRITNSKAEGCVIGALIFKDDVWAFHTLNWPCFDASNSESTAVSQRQLIKLCREKFPDMRIPTSVSESPHVTGSDNPNTDESSHDLRHVASMPPGGFDNQEVSYGALSQASVPGSMNDIQPPQYLGPPVSPEYSQGGPPLHPYGEMSPHPYGEMPPPPPPGYPMPPEYAQLPPIDQGYIPAGLPMVHPGMSQEGIAPMPVHDPYLGGAPPSQYNPYAQCYD